MIKRISYKLCLILLSNLFIISATRAQVQTKVDSLEGLLPKLKSDSAKADALIKLAVLVVDNIPTKAMEFAKQAVRISVQINNKKFQAQALHNIGDGYYTLGDYKNALSFYLQAIQAGEKGGFKKEVAKSTSSVGSVYGELNKNEEALEYLNKSLNTFKEIGDKRGVAVVQTSIGNIYDSKKEYKKALNNYSQAIKTFQAISDKVAVATNFNNMANAYQNLKDYPKALNYITKALSIYQDAGDVYGISLALNNIGDFYYITGQYQKSIDYFKQGLEKGNQIAASDRIITSYKGLADSYRKLENYKAALDYNLLFLELNDSLYNKESSKQMAEMQTRYETENKEKEIELLSKEKEIHIVESKNQLFIRNTLLGSSFLVLGFAFWRARVKQIANRKLQDKNNEIESKNQKLQLAYEVIEERNKDISDSINYARNIQQAILPSVDDFGKYFKETFVLYKPKDVVSGDFYFMAEKENKVIVAAVDCTGHGVPGAFMSMIGNDILNQVILEKGILNPGEILSSLNKGIKSALRQSSGSESKDGMDIGLSVFDFGKMTVDFAGAHRPMYFFQNSELKEVKGDRISIGGLTPDDYTFQTHSIQMSPNDVFYLCTDGYADQFGGQNEKKFKTGAFKELLEKIHLLSLTDQKYLIEDAFHHWKGELQQVDDILIIGLKNNGSSFN